MASFTYARTSRLLDEERRRLERLRSTLSEKWAAAGGAEDAAILEDLDRRLNELDLAVGRLADARTVGARPVAGRSTRLGSRRGPTPPSASRIRP
jgi:hypothetical protein